MSAVQRPWILNVGYPRVLVFSIGHSKYQSSTLAVQRPWVLNIGYPRVLVLNVSHPTVPGPHHWLSEGPGLQHQPFKVLVLNISHPRVLVLNISNAGLTH